MGIKGCEIYFSINVSQINPFNQILLSSHYETVLARGQWYKQQKDLAFILNGLIGQLM